MNDSDPIVVLPLRAEKVPQDFICAICLSVPLNPWVVRRCSHVFCKDCIAKCIEVRKECPVCRCDIYQCGWNTTRSGFLPLQPLISESPLSHRIWSGIEVKCQDHEEGCGWTGHISDYGSHRKVCTTGKYKGEHKGGEKDLCTDSCQIENVNQTRRQLEEEIKHQIEKIRYLKAEYKKTVFKLIKSFEGVKAYNDESQRQPFDNIAESIMGRWKGWRRGKSEFHGQADEGGKEARTAAFRLYIQRHLEPRTDVPVAGIRGKD